MTWALHTDIDLDGANLHLAELEAAGLLGIVEVGGRATVYLPAPVASLSLVGHWEPVADQDWERAWRRRLAPVTVGSFTIAPPWLADRGHPEQIVVIEPGQAFGTGHHETTAGCLAALQEFPLAGTRVLDVGAGSGILAICAGLLGASEVVAVDVDPLAVEATVANAERNGAAVDARLGSVDVAGSAPFDVVAANLDTATLSAMAPYLAAALACDGTLVASGVSLPRLEEAVAALGRAGLTVQARPGREWAVLVAAHR